MPNSSSRIPARTCSPSRKIIQLASDGHGRARSWTVWLRWRASTGREFSPFPLVRHIPRPQLLNPRSPRAYISPTLFPNKEDILPESVSAISPVTSGAHPLITSLSCAALHPSDPSCTRTFLTFWLRSFPPLTQLLLLVYSAMLVPRLSALYHFPLSTLHRLVSAALRTSAFFTGSLATAWSSICFFQTWFPRTFLPTQRFFLGGFLAGLWALAEKGRPGSRTLFLSAAKASAESLWKVGVKRRWWRAVRGGDVWVFVAALMLMGVAYERDANAVRDGTWRKGISWVRGEGWRDWAIEEEEEEDEDKEEEDDGRGHREGDGNVRVNGE